MPAPTLQDFQYWFGELENLGHHGSQVSDGKLFGINTDIDVVSAEGIESLEVQSGTRKLPRNDGSVPGLHVTESKTPIFELETIGHTEYLDLLQFFKKSRNDEGELHWKFPDQDQHFMRARVLRRSDRQDGFTQERRPVNVAFEVSDPRMYRVGLETEFLNIYNPSGGGIDWEIDWEVDFSSAEGQDVVLHNHGNEEAYPILTVFGPTTGTCTGINLQNLTTGGNLEVVTDILTGQQLKADMDARVRGSGTRIIEVAGASRYGDWVLPRDTFYLQSGDNVIRFEITGTSADVTASISWRHTSQ